MFFHFLYESFIENFVTLEGFTSWSKVTKIKIIFRLTWYIEHRDLHVDGKYKVETTVEKLLSEKDSAIDNRNQHDRNKDAEQMAKVRSDVEQLRAIGASQDAILATVIGKPFF